MSPHFLLYNINKEQPTTLIRIRINNIINALASTNIIIYFDIVDTANETFSQGEEKTLRYLIKPFFIEQTVSIW